MKTDITSTEEAKHYDSRVLKRELPISVNVEERYQEKIKKGNYMWFSNNRFYNELKTYKNKKVLDMACGTGFLTVFLAKIGANVTSFDISPKSVEYAIELSKINGVGDKVNIEVHDATNLPYKSDYFDLITGEDALHHIIKYKGTLENLYRVLKPGAKVIVQEPFCFNPIVNLLRWINVRIKHHEGESFIGKKELAYIDKIFDSYKIEERCVLYIFSRFFAKKKSNFFKKLNIFFKNLDTIFCKIFPFLKRYYAYGYLIMEKHPK